ncbi:MAG TPA: lipoyl(octanoyl) transferase LipB [Actinomycetota bacterium]|nr:lipoyl(octanoyl) transferase LipB [Actinomycetota bacterium]
MRVQPRPDTSRTLRVVEPGLVPYAAALEWQGELHRRRVAGEIDDVVLLLEHPHVYTLGRRFAPEHLLADPTALAARGIELYEADRGGSITYHGPGQLVGYPILALEPPADAIAYLRSLEEVLIRVCADFSVAAGRREGMTGVWVEEQKLASIGVNVTRGVTKHGFALNVAPDLAFFGGMVPCGLPVEVTSLERLLGTAPEPGRVVASVVRHLGGVLRKRPERVADAGLLGVTMRPEAAVLPFPRPGGPLPDREGYSSNG